MSLVAQIYESAANAGLLKECLWYPSNGAPSQRHQVGFAAPDESLLDGLTLSTDYEMTYTSWLQWNYGASVSLDMRSKTMESYGKQAQQDRRALEDFISRKTLTGNERQNLERIKQTWRQAMAQPLLWGKDLERELIDYMEQNQGEFYRRGGMAKSDTVPAMLTPGEFVVNKDAVSRYGAGFFEAINNLSAPAQALAGRALAGVQGFATGGLVQPSGSRLARPVLATDAGPSRTVRVELSSGQQKVNATVDARDEARLLQLLDAARARTA